MFKGISIPIAFFYHYGKQQKYAEVMVYFSIKPIEKTAIDIFSPGEYQLKKSEKLIKKLYPTTFDCLVPFKVSKDKKYEAPNDMKFVIGTDDKNPTTATLLNKISMLPCSSNNLGVLLETFSYPDFYIGIKENKLFLYIKHSDKEYREIPSQPYSHNCWPGFAHSSITLNQTNGASHIHRYTDIDWIKISNEINDYKNHVIEKVKKHSTPSSSTKKNKSGDTTIEILSE